MSDEDFQLNISRDRHYTTTLAKHMTKRDYFAGLAMQSLLPRHRIESTFEAMEVARSAVMCADELMKELANDKES
jgi:hypothetical protein